VKRYPQAMWPKLAIIAVVTCLIGCSALLATKLLSTIKSHANPSETTYVPEPLPPHKIVKTSEQFVKLWEKSNVIPVGPVESTNLITTKDNQVCMVTIQNPNDTSTSLTCMNLLTGQLEWEIDGDDLRPNLTNNSKYVFAGNIYSRVKAYDLESGNFIWSTHLPQTRSLNYVTATETELYVATNPGNFYALEADTGAIKDTIPYPDIGSSLLWVQEGIAYWHQYPLLLMASDIKTGNVKWQVQFDGGFDTLPIFVDGFIFVTTHNGQLYAIDYLTGNTLWQTAKPDTLEHSERVVSNVAVSNDIVYFLTQNAQLRALDIQTGQLLGAQDFVPSLFDLNTNITNYKFDVAAANEVVTVYFGDSWQLLTFRFLPNS
jgi:outer membrane protein assembly factor BamB